MGIDGFAGGLAGLQGVGRSMGGGVIHPEVGKLKGAKNSPVRVVGSALGLHAKHVQIFSGLG